MKFDPQKSFGYPVLRPGSEDYLQAGFQSGLTLGINENNETEYVLAYDIAIGVAEIRALVLNKSARVVIEVTCRTTFFSKLFELESLKGSVTLDANQIRERLELSCYAITNKKIPKFHSDKINPEFGGSTVAFPHYAVLACDAPINYWVEREVFKNITSIFDYRVDNALGEGLWRLNLEENRVQIILSQAQLEILKHAESEKKNQVIIANAIVFAAVTEMVNVLKFSQDHHELRWAQIVSAKCSALGILVGPKTDAIDTAQKLMARPLSMLNLKVFKAGEEQ
jgi:hypothetical protein